MRLPIEALRLKLRVLGASIRYGYWDAVKWDCEGVPGLYETEQEALHAAINHFSKEKALHQNRSIASKVQVSRTESKTK